MKKLICLTMQTLVMFCLMLISCNKIDQPIVSIAAATSITSTTATGNFSITNPSNANITAAGICYSSTYTSPKLTDYRVLISGGALSGNYTVELSSLSANTTYYTRAYISYNGRGYYSTVQSFSTSSAPTKLSLANLDSNMITVPGGSFTMGATSEQLANNGDGFTSPWWSPTTQEVSLSSYKICRFEVTQQLWLDVMGNNPSYFTGDLQRPVERVSWDDCEAFITKLNQLTGKSYRLPTEAEWEYAARGGASSTYSYIYSGSNTFNDVAWYGSYRGLIIGTHTVGTKQANALGIFDMSGNVFEWCGDWEGNYSSTAVTNPTGPSSGSYRVLRGGSWLPSSNFCRVSYRYSNAPSISSDFYGFRLSL